MHVNHYSIYVSGLLSIIFIFLFIIVFQMRFACLCGKYRDEMNHGRCDFLFSPHYLLSFLFKAGGTLATSPLLQAFSRASQIHIQLLGFFTQANINNFFGTYVPTVPFYQISEVQVTIYKSFLLKNISLTQIFFIFIFLHSNFQVF